MTPAVMTDNAPDDPQAGIEHIMTEETSERKEHINRFEEMRKPLRRVLPD